MQKLVLIVISALLLSGCEPSFKEEYEATLKELETTKAALAEAQEKLKSADNEIRHNLFTLMRRASNHLQSTDIEASRLKEYSQELVVHSESYLQLNPEADHVSTTAVFYAKQLESITTLLVESKQVYDRRFTECLRGIGNKQQSKNDLSNMLCEVQADVAKEDIEADLEASIKALATIFEEQLKAGRQASSSNVELKALEKRFRQLVEENKSNNDKA